MNRIERVKNVLIQKENLIKLFNYRNNEKIIKKKIIKKNYYSHANKIHAGSTRFRY